MIDVKELKIGSSVLVNGVRAKVIDIHRDILNSQKSSYRVFVEGISPETGKLMQVGGYEFDPIPLTEELLKEFGFEEIVEEGLNMFIRFVSAKGSPFGSYIMRVSKLTDDWEFEIHPIYRMRGKYLHELEQFVFMTTKKELI